MGRMGKNYQNRIALVVQDGLNSYLSSDKNPEENEFRKWLENKKLYYQNRIVNAVVKKKPANNTLALAYTTIEVYKIMEEQYGKK